MEQEKKKIKILLIDDSPGNAVTLAKLLMEKGYNCQVVTGNEFENQRIKETVTPFDMEAINLNLIEDIKEDNHCWWQRFQKGPEIHHENKSRKYKK